MIREALYSDARAITRLLIETWRSMPYGHIPVDRARLARTVHTYLVGGDEMFSWVSDRGGVGGVLLASLAPLDMAVGTAASDQAFICRTGEGAALVRAYKRWAEEQGAALVTLSVSSRNERAERLIGRLGFEHVGGNYQLRTGQ